MEVKATRCWYNSSQRWPIRLYFKVNKIRCYIGLKKKDWKRGDWRCRHLSYFFPSLLCWCNQLWKKYIVFYLSWVSLLFHVCVQIDPWLRQIVYVISMVGRKEDELKTRYKKESDSHPQRQNFWIKGNRNRKKKEKDFDKSILFSARRMEPGSFSPSFSYHLVVIGIWHLPCQSFACEDVRHREGCRNMRPIPLQSVLCSKVLLAWCRLKTVLPFLLCGIWYEVEWFLMWILQNDITISV